MNEFLAMGGYAAFVWTAYAVAAVVLVALLADTLHGLRSRERTLAALESLRGGRRRRRPIGPEATDDA
jgi:heme exporter protein D